MKDHWNRAYASKEINDLGWYEKIPSPSLQLISKCDIDTNSPILDVGAGASTFIDSLVKKGYKNITAADISEEALHKLKERLGKEKTSLIRWIIDDVTEPKHLQKLKNIAVWHDRALLHFLVESTQQNTYLSTLNKVIKHGGYVIIAAFSLSGATKCCGLKVNRYNQNTLKDFLGEDFELLEYFDYLYHTPSGNTRPYIYTLFQKNRG
ncbi:class I SAM-dependent methyltransferase [Candidatus Woesearchaeota archaeon]|nr:class I SAM-dependent methyltransferase [Candidatus Woesearchaeota archaeon]